MFGAFSQFNSNYLTPIQRYSDQTAIGELRRKIYPFILRRTKQQVLTSLPKKVEQVVYVEMSKEQKAFYENRRKYYQETVNEQVETQGIEKSQFLIFQALSELRQLASCPEAKTDDQINGTKRESLMEQLEDALANNHKILVFTNYLATVEYISTDLQNIGINSVTMTGATSNREAVVKKFQENPDCRVFISTLKTGGVGLNLTAADMVFIYDPWWNKAVENQAIDRTHRMGQKNPVFAYKMVSKGTIEEKIIKLQEKKSKLFDQLIGADSAAIKSLSEEDINFMLS
jgi:SNF2 family DNA or RNA helicase